MEKQVRRLVTRSDFDGLACAMMLKELNLIDETYVINCRVTPCASRKIVVVR